MKKVKELFEGLRDREEIMRRIPISSGFSLPVPVLLDDRPVLRIPAVPFSGRCGALRKRGPPSHRIALNLESGDLVEIAEAADFLPGEMRKSGQVGTFPGAGARGLAGEELRKLRESYCEATDALVHVLKEVRAGGEERDELVAWKGLFSKLVEDGLMPYYRQLSPELLSSVDEPSATQGAPQEDRVSRPFQMRREGLLDIITELHRIADDLKNPGVAGQLRRLQERLDQDDFYLVVLGEFSRGKTQLVNSLLGESLLPISAKPTTVTINILRYGGRRRARIVMRDGQSKEVPCTAEALKAETIDNIEQVARTRYVEVEHPCPLLAPGICLVDTPGVNDPDEHRMTVTYGFIPNADAVVFVMDVTQPFTASERRFLEEPLHHELCHAVDINGKAVMDDHACRREIVRIFYIKTIDCTRARFPIPNAATLRRVAFTSINNSRSNIWQRLATVPNTLTVWRCPFWQFPPQTPHKIRAYGTEECARSLA